MLERQRLELGWQLLWHVEDGVDITWTALCSVVASVDYRKVEEARRRTGRRHQFIAKAMHRGASVFSGAELGPPCLVSRVALEVSLTRVDSGRMGVAMDTRTDKGHLFVCEHVKGVCLGVVEVAEGQEALLLQLDVPLSAGPNGLSGKAELDGNALLQAMAGGLMEST